MYEKRFGLHRKPFQAVQKSSDYFASEAYNELLPAVLNALQSDLGVAVLTGPAGVGKSVTLESFRRLLQPNAQTLFVRGGAVRKPDDLLYALYRHLLKAQPGSEPHGVGATVRRWDVVERLQRLSEFWGPLTILVDDVHLVEVDVFCELRSLLEEEFGGQKLVRLLVAGPLLLEEVLAQPAMGDFAQKIRTHVFLEPLRSTESVDYLAHHVANAGGALEDLFETSAVEKVVVAADGLPRCLNLLADESLMICEETDKNRVTSDIVNKALSRLMHLPVTWNATVDREDDSDDDVFDTDTQATDSVIEIGGAVEELSHGVIEFGAPSNEVTSRPSDFQPPDETIAPSVASSVDVGFNICEFVAEDENCRDNGVIEHIGEISDAINSAESPSVEFDLATDTFDGQEISAEAFVQEVDTDAAAEIEECTESVYENEHLFEAILSKAEPCEDERVSLFTRWEPAGAWPPIVTEERQEVSSQGSQRGNASPVFDRYTWCELGRGVSSQPLTRNNMLPTTATVADWPPRLQGIAPEFSITIEDASDDDQGLLPDLGTVVGKNLTHMNHAEDIESITVNYSVGESLTLSDVSLAISADEELRLPETQEAFFAEESETPVLDGPAQENVAEDDGLLDDNLPVVDEGDEIVSLPMGESFHTQPPEGVFNSEIDAAPADANSPSMGDEVVPDDADQNDDGSNSVMGSTTDVASLIANAVQRYISDAETVDPSEPHQTSRSSISPGDGQTTLIIDEESIEESIEEYAPRLLQEARSRVISVLAAQGQLKQAAGAENASFPAKQTEDAQSAARPHLSISQHDHDPLQNEEHTVAESPSTGPRFHDLFTRLRKLKRRSA